MNPWLLKFLIANADIIFEALNELADLTETDFDDMAVEILEGPVKEYLLGLQGSDVLDWEPDL